MILNVYGPNNGASKYVEQKLIEQEGEIEKSRIIVVDINSLLSETDKTDINKLLIQKISKNVEILNNTNHKLNLIDIYRTL